MEKTGARPFSKVLGSNGIPNKQQILFHFENSDGGDETISMPIGESLALIEMIAAQHGAFSVRDKAEMPVLSVKWFELGRDQDKNLVLVLTLRSGGKLSFSVPRGLDSPMSDVLRTNASLPPCEQPPNLRNSGDARPHLSQNLNEMPAMAWVIATRRFFSGLDRVKFGLVTSIGFHRARDFRALTFGRTANSRLATKSSREIRTFWYSMMALGTAISAVGMLTHDGPVQQYELVGGLAILIFSLARLFLLKSRGRKRRGWSS